MDAEQERRLAKLDALRDDGIEPYPYRFDRSATLGELRRRHGELEPGTETDEHVARRRAGPADPAPGPAHLRHDPRPRGEHPAVRLAEGRRRRRHGTGRTTSTSATGSASTGVVMTTNKGELSVKVDRVELLAKALRPLPDKWKGLSDVDTRYRQRYVDLIVNEDARRAFEVRHAVIASIRRSLADRGFIEVETPVLHVEAGRRPRPPVRHPPQRARHGPLPAHRPRAAPEAADRRRHRARLRDRPGVPQRGHRTEVQPRVHDARGVPGVRRLHRHDGAHRGAHRPGGARRPRHDRHRDRRRRTVDLAAPWRRARLLDLVTEVVGQRGAPVDAGRRAASAVRRPRRRRTSPTWAPGKLCMELYDALVEPTLVAPTFVIDHPREVSPLARVDRDDPDLVERFELVGARPRAGQRLQRAERPRRPAPRGSRTSSGPRRPATPRPAPSTRTTCGRSSTACRRRAASASASTGW